MEPSQTQEHIINLGKQRTASLGRAYEVGPLARWMSHYIAEQMALAESAAGEAREAAQQKCFDTILRLWSQRSSMPRAVRPFQSFEPIFETLKRLDSSTPRFLRYVRHGLPSEDKESLSEAEMLAQAIDTVDESARTLISELLSLALESAADDDSMNYLKSIQDEMDAPDAQAVRHLVERFQAGDTSDEQVIERLNARLQTLERFASLAAGVKNILQERIDAAAQKTELRSKQPKQLKRAPAKVKQRS